MLKRPKTVQRINTKANPLMIGDSPMDQKVITNQQKRVIKKPLDDLQSPSLFIMQQLID